MKTARQEDAFAYLQAFAWVIAIGVLFVAAFWKIMVLDADVVISQDPARLTAASMELKETIIMSSNEQPYDIAGNNVEFLAEPVGEVEVMQMLNRIEPMGPHTTQYGELSKAIASAATADPLFPWRPDGCRWTAAVLVAIAWTGSRFHPNLISNGGKSFGLYQIEPPTAQVNASILLKPADASYVAIDLVRQSLIAGRKKSWEERLTSFGPPGEPDVMRKSLERMLLANDIMQKHYPVSRYALPPAPEK